MPVYNVAGYIEKCVRSLFEQTLNGFEILFVNDCSPDRSIEIIEHLIEEYRLSIREKELIVKILTMPSNMGLAYARRKGIIEATGDYIIHCDGDDWIDIDLYEKMYNESVVSGADVVLCDSLYEFAGKSESHKVELAYSNGKEIARNWYNKCLGMHCWNKLVRRSLYIDNEVLPWDGLNMWEDNGLMIRVFYYADRISQIHGSFYHYNRSNLKAMTNDYGQKRVSQMIEIAEHITDFFEKQPDANDFRKTVMAFQFLAKINLITDSFSRISNYRAIFPGSESIASELDSGAFSIRGRVRFNMVRLNLAWLFVLMYKMRNWFICPMKI